MAPAVIVCRHLLDGTSREWVEIVPDDHQEVSDWICRDCAERFPDIPVEDLRSVCMHCCRAFREGR
jgi:hypothetical protein